MATELEVTDSQQNCECSSQMHVTPFKNTTNNHLFESFSQPISTENMLLNSQIHATQTQTQYGSSLASASQSPLLKLVKRMTRMFVHTNVDGATEELKKLFTRFMYDYKVSITNQRQRQITVITSDKRQTLLTFKVNISEILIQAFSVNGKSKNTLFIDFFEK